MLVLNTTSKSRTAPLCLPIIEEAVACYLRVVKESLVSVRLLGSVARGEAIPGESDIDFVGVVDGQQTCSCRLGKKFTDVRSTMSVDAVNASSLFCCIYPLNWRQMK
jgi:predicted nucleotidyltransferase